MSCNCGNSKPFKKAPQSKPGVGTTYNGKVRSRVEIVDRVTDECCHKDGNLSVETIIATVIGVLTFLFFVGWLVINQNSFSTRRITKHHKTSQTITNRRKQ